VRHNNNITNSILQDIHHIAAARQLEVLERIQEEHLSPPESANDLLFLPNIIDESYIQLYIYSLSLECPRAYFYS
jgi:hypothetical protein